MFKKKEGGFCDYGISLLTRFLRHPLVPVGFVETFFEFVGSILTWGRCFLLYNWLRFSRLIAPNESAPMFRAIPFSP
jgi:hypothetical protein